MMQGWRSEKINQTMLESDLLTSLQIPVWKTGLEVNPTGLLTPFQQMTGCPVIIYKMTKLKSWSMTEQKKMGLHHICQLKIMKLRYLRYTGFSFFTNSYFLITIFLQSDVLHLWYFKFHKICNIKICYIKICYLSIKKSKFTIWKNFTIGLQMYRY